MKDKYHRIIDGHTAFLTIEDDGRFTWNIALRGALLTGYQTYKRERDAFRAANKIYRSIMK